MVLRHDNYLSRRWGGRVPWAVLFWRDMLVVGTVLNLSASLAAMALAARGADLLPVVALHFAPLPFNLLLFAAAWRRPGRPAAQVLLAATWLAVMTVV